MSTGCLSSNLCSPSSLKCVAPVAARGGLIVKSHEMLAGSGINGDSDMASTQVKATTSKAVVDRTVPIDTSFDRAPAYLDEMPELIGWDRKSYPTGWFQVAWSDEIAPGVVRPLKYFGKDFVLYRTEGGEAVLQSAFCPHMGAHLGFGGHVRGDRIVCPYHGWEWGCDGRNKLVPSDGRPSGANRALRNYPTAETSGIVWMWHDVLHRAPMWDPPCDYSKDEEYLPVWPHTVHKTPNVRLQPQWVAENTVDVDHLLFVHQSKVIPTLASERTPVRYSNDGHIWRNDREHPLQSSHVEGVGVAIITVPRDPDQPRRVPSVLISATTPIDEDHSDFFHTNLILQDKEAEGGEGLVPVGRAARRVATFTEQGTRDMPIWANMAYINRPAYSSSEGVFRKFRKWCDQFYPDVDADASSNATAKG